MGIFDNINFNIPPSTTSSRDFRLLDTTCDHLVRNESVSNFNINALSTSINYSGNSALYNNFAYNTQIDPSSSTIIKTQLPWVNVGTLAVYQTINTTPSNPITETFTVSSDLTKVYSMAFPPVTNSTTAQQRIYINSTDYRLVNFSNYTLSQLYGSIQFNNVNDANSQVDFTYLARKKLIVPVDAVSKQVNYQILGVDQNGSAIIQIYGRALASTQSRLVLRYTTTLQSCTKCAGQGILNDIYFDYNGRIQQVYDFSKMIQDMFKRLLTIRGSNVFDPNEGTNVTTYLGMTKADGLVLSDLIKSDIVALIYAIRDKQNLQATTGQTISLAEQIAQVNQISVRATSPTDMEVLIEVVSKSGVIQQISVPVSTGTTGA